MGDYSDIYGRLVRLGACEEALLWTSACHFDAVSFSPLWQNCVEPSWMFWILIRKMGYPKGPKWFLKLRGLNDPKYKWPTKLEIFECSFRLMQELELPKMFPEESTPIKKLFNLTRGYLKGNCNHTYLYMHIEENDAGFVDNCSAVSNCLRVLYFWANYGKFPYRKGVANMSDRIFLPYQGNEKLKVQISDFIREYFKNYSFEYI